MSGFEIALSASSMSAAVASIVYVSYLVRVSGRDRPNNPDLVKHFVESAPMNRLDNVLSK
jgi:hypothetical protein